MCYCDGSFYAEDGHISYTEKRPGAQQKNYILLFSRHKLGRKTSRGRCLAIAFRIILRCRLNCFTLSLMVPGQSTSSPPHWEEGYRPTHQHWVTIHLLTSSLLCIPLSHSSQTLFLLQVRTMTHLIDTQLWRPTRFMALVRFCTSISLILHLQFEWLRIQGCIWSRVCHSIYSAWSRSTVILLARKIIRINTFLRCNLAIGSIAWLQRQDGIHRRALKSPKEYKKTDLWTLLMA